MKKNKYTFKKLPDNTPVQLMPELTREKQLIHRGVFSHDLTKFYYTVSDDGFLKFDVKCIHFNGGLSSDAHNAFFNSEYNEHGMSFSHDGNTIFFSSTRPVHREGGQDTWHIWKSEKKNDTWSTPQCIDIPNLRDKLFSHPTVTKDGTLYFHVSNLDYSNMDIYYSKPTDHKYGDAQKVLIPDTDVCKCTPYISPDEKILIYAAITKQLDLYICYKNDMNEWSIPKVLPGKINSNNQGNPVITPDGEYLLYAGINSNGNWSIYRVSIKEVINYD